jgi:hypothetical protein
MRSEMIQNVFYDNYDDFQLANFIFSPQKNKNKSKIKIIYIYIYITILRIIYW